jgi:L-malate glycosyltransferase
MIQLMAGNERIVRGSQDCKLIHVLFVVDQLSKVLGGGERIALQLAALMPEQGFRASILTFHLDPDNSFLADAPCPVYGLPLRRTYDFKALRAAIEFGRFLHDQEVRIVQTFFESSDLWAGLVTRMTSRAKLVWSRRDMGILRTRKHALAYRLFAGIPDAVFAVSEQVRRFSIEVDRVPAGRVDTVYNGVDVRAYETAGRRTDTEAIQIAMVGNIRRVKGHDLLLRAAVPVLARFPEVTFCIAGEVLEPEYFRELQRLAQTLGVSDRVRFVGRVEDLPRYLSAMDAFVLPSRSEGFSNALIEAMAASLPVVATNVGGNGEAVEDGVSGLLVPADDWGALADAMIRLLSNRAAARAMGEAGNRRVRLEFSTEIMLRRTTATYRRLLFPGVAALTFSDS